VIAIVDYGMGNLKSVEKAFRKLGWDALVTSDPSVIASSYGLVLPGVGAFGRCMENLRNFNLADSITRHIEQGKPFLGICLGLQILFEESAESPGVQGLGVLKGRVVRFTPRTEGQFRLKIPHMGWNRVAYTSPSPIFRGIPEGSWFYFVHSYYVLPDDPGVVAGITDYGDFFASAVSRGSLFALQFHPEKSGNVGLCLLDNFAKIVGESGKGAETSD
jgi:glutamine amidotransferase